jgi:hypothetical protein
MDHGGQHGRQYGTAQEQGNAGTEGPANGVVAVQLIELRVVEFVDRVRPAGDGAVSFCSTRVMAAIGSVEVGFAQGYGMAFALIRSGQVIPMLLTMCPVRSPAAVAQPWQC